MILSQEIIALREMLYVRFGNYPGSSELHGNLASSPYIQRVCGPFEITKTGPFRPCPLSGGWFGDGDVSPLYAHENKVF